MLLAAGAACALVSRTAGERLHRRPWLALAALLTFMGVDEGITIHEHLEQWTGIGWIKLYAPLIVIGGTGWSLVLRRMWPLKTERAMFIAGAFCWTAAQVLEKFEATDAGRVHGYALMSTTEEALEATGSALFLLALVRTLQVIERRGTGPAVDVTSDHLRRRLLRDGCVLPHRWIRCAGGCRPEPSSDASLTPTS